MTHLLRKIGISKDADAKLPKAKPLVVDTKIPPPPKELKGTPPPKKLKGKKGKPAVKGSDIPPAKGSDVPPPLPKPEDDLPPTGGDPVPPPPPPADKKASGGNGSGAMTNVKEGGKTALREGKRVVRGTRDATGATLKIGASILEGVVKAGR